ncbi:hypothetical protein BDZ89DRAFT_1076329 [Hymenopellis radicata]|nr:hypothetical protein BDZ89DRAFT_1076329 [Hymenopellis radicata]
MSSSYGSIYSSAYRSTNSVGYSSLISSRPRRPAILSSTEVFSVATATVNVLRSLGYSSCFVGSVACSVYGMSRTPNDIDIVVLGCSVSQEELKRQVTNFNSDFYTIASKDPLATYRVLWYRLSGYHRSCKVDLLLPGVMNIPNVPTVSIIHRDHAPTSYGDRVSRPLMPFIPLLLLKLQAWMDHGESAKMHMRLKQPVDVADIKELLRLFGEKRVGTVGGVAWIPESFLGEGRRRVRAFVKAHPDTRKAWEKVVF